MTRPGRPVPRHRHYLAATSWLAAALAAGETPSPGMVAAARETTALPLPVTCTCLVSAVAGLFLTCRLAQARAELPRGVSDRWNLLDMIACEWNPRTPRRQRPAASKSNNIGELARRS
jgi:hypothetical protein